MLTVPQAARRAKRDPETLRRWIRSGRLRATKVGTQHLIEEDDLADEFVGALLGELDAQLELLPVICGLNPLPLAHHESDSCRSNEKERGRNIAM